MQLYAHADGLFCLRESGIPESDGRGEERKEKKKKERKKKMGIRETLTGHGQSIADRVRVDRAPQMLGEGRKDGPRESLTSRSRPREVARGHQI